MIRTLTRGLAQVGVEVHIATTDDNGPGRLQVPYLTPLFADNVCYWYFPRQTRFYTFSWPLNHWLAQHVRDYDLVHIHALFSCASTAAAFWSRRSGIPYIVRPLGVLNRWGMQNRHPYLKQFSFRLIERRILARAARVHYTSEQERAEATALGIAQKAAIIPNAVDITSGSVCRLKGQFRSRYPQLVGRRVILFLSRLDAKKGLDLLLPAFARIRFHCSSVSLVLAGEGNPTFVARLQKQAVCLGIDTDLVWTGLLTDEDKWEALADASMLVLPSYSENFGVAVVEAMAAGVPVVISDQVGIHREVSEAEAGVVVPCDEGKLSQALCALVDDERARLRMGSNGRRLVQQRLSLQTVTAQMFRLYTDITRERTAA
jgi:glycosyltransferase involved in cell wall biosynthesis